MKRPIGIKTIENSISFNHIGFNQSYLYNTFMDRTIKLIYGQDDDASEVLSDFPYEESKYLHYHDYSQ